MIARVQEGFKIEGFVLTGQGGSRHPGDRRRARSESGGHRGLDETRVLRVLASFVICRLIVLSSPQPQTLNHSSFIWKEAKARK